MKRISMWMLAAILICGTSVVTSCSNEDIPDVVETEEKTEFHPHAISMEEALLSLQKFLDDTSEEATTRAAARKIGDVFAVKYEKVATRAALSEDFDCENLLYVANFENERGFAVLAADDRIENEILAVTEKGSLSNKDMDSAMESLFCEERPVVKGYPLTGDGFFTVDEYPGELFMNPNTVSLYVPEENDTLVGNFDETDDEDVTRANPDSPEGLRGRMVGALCLAYTIDHIIDDDGRIIGGGGGGGSSTRTETLESWATEKFTPSLLATYKYWKQSSPFNDLCPERRKFVLLGDKKKAAAGCFPLAISKIMTHFENPNRFTYNGYTVDWAQLKTNFNSTVGLKSAAALLRGVGVSCDSWYFYQGTFTFPNKATSYMRFIGYNNAHSRNYSFSRVTEMIDKGCPLIIYGVPGINIFNSHAWNIDGYKVKVKTTTTRTYVGNSLQNETTRTESLQMVHCDFGWEGAYNGYYVSGVFDSRDSRTEFDSNAYNQSKKRKYNTLMKVITYDKPI